MTKKNKKKVTKKNTKAIIMIATGAIVFTITSLSIGVIIGHASFKSATTDVKNAKMALERLSTTQKIVDLTKDANQKLPSKIAPIIKSMKALNALIQGVIITPNGITYTPDIVEIHDNKREFVVEMEIKKNNVRDKFQFVVTGFTTKVEYDVAKALSKINDDTIKGNNAKLSSAMIPRSIATLRGFPKEINGVYFNTLEKSHNYAKGELTIILTATKGNVSENKEVTISGFKISTQAQADQIDIKNALAKINNATIKGNNAKSPSRMDPKLIKELKGFPKKTNGVHFDVTWSYATDAAGTLLITLTATKGNVSENKNIIISDFKKQPQSGREDIYNAVAKINNKTISGDINILPSEFKKESRLVENLKGFPQTTSNGVRFRGRAARDGYDDAAGTLIIGIVVSKLNSPGARFIFVKVSGFKKQPQSESISST